MTTQIDVRMEVVASNLREVVPLLALIGSSAVPKREQVTVAASTFTALSPPTGAKAVLIDMGSALSLTLKGVTGDTGIAIMPSSSPTPVPVLLPLGTSPSIGITSAYGSGQAVTVWWIF